MKRHQSQRPIWRGRPGALGTERSPCPSDEHATAAHLSLSLAAEPSSGARQVRSAEAPAAGLSRACGRQRRAVESGDVLRTAVRYRYLIDDHHARFYFGNWKDRSVSHNLFRQRRGKLRPILVMTEN